MLYCVLPLCKIHTMVKCTVSVEAVFTFRVTAACYDSCAIDTEHPTTGICHVGLVTKVKHSRGPRSRDIEITYTVTGIEPRLPMREKLTYELNTSLQAQFENLEFPSQ